MASSSTQVDEPFISHDLENEEQRALSSGTTVGPPSKRTNSKRSIASRHSTKSQESKPPNVVVIMCVTVFLVAGSIGAGWLEWYLKFSEKGQGQYVLLSLVFFAQSFMGQYNINRNYTYICSSRSVKSSNFFF